MLERKPHITEVFKFQDKEVSAQFLYYVLDEAPRHTSFQDETGDYFIDDNRYCKPSG